MMNDNRQVKAGDTVYLSPTRDKARSCKPGAIFTAPITKVGAKYYTVKHQEREIRFSKKTLEEVTDYSPDWEMFFSEQDLLDSRVVAELRSQLINFFSYTYSGPSELSRNQLERIVAIIHEETKED